MKGRPRAASANAAGLALTPARLASTMAASQPAPSISASAFSFSRHAGNLVTGFDEQVFEVERYHRFILDNKDA